MEIAAKSDHFARLLQPRAGPSAVASDVSIPLYGFESKCYVTVMANGPWCGKWALVTGASSGIGAALAEELAAGGANLVLTARRARRLANLRASLCASHGVRIKVLAADLVQPNTAAEIFAFTRERGITIDLLVNNAGVGSYGEFRSEERRVGKECRS